MRNPKIAAYGFFVIIRNYKDAIAVSAYGLLDRFRLGPFVPQYPLSDGVRFDGALPLSQQVFDVVFENDSRLEGVVNERSGCVEEVTKEQIKTTPLCQSLNSDGKLRSITFGQEIRP